MGSELWASVTVEEIKSSSPNSLVTGPFGSAISSRFFQASGVPVIRGSNLSEELCIRLKEEEFAFLSPEKAKEFSRSATRRGDLVFTCWGTVGQVGLIDERAKFDEYIISNKQMKLTPDSTKANSLYLYYVFSSPEMMSRVTNQAIGSSVPGFNLGQLRNLCLRLPPLGIQKSIAQILGTFDDKIELNRRMNATLESMARALFQSWFVDFDPVRAKQQGREPAGLDVKPAALFPAEFEPSGLGDIPKGWEAISLAELMDIQGGTQPPASEFVDQPTNGYVRLVQIRDYETDAHRTYIPDKPKWRRCEAEDIMIARYGASVGRICWGLEGAYNVALVKAVPATESYREFLRTFLLSDTFQHRLIGMSARSAQAGFNKGDIESFRIVKPPEHIAARYQELAWEIRSSCLQRKKQSRTLAELRDTLLPRLLSGELSVADSERVLEKAL